MNFKAKMNERVEQIEQILDQYLPPKEEITKNSFNCNEYNSKGRRKTSSSNADQ